MRHLFREELRKHHNVCDEEPRRATDKAYLEILDWYKYVLAIETILLKIDSSIYSGKFGREID